MRYCKSDFQAFNRAAKNISPAKSTALELNSLYTISNETGLNIEIMPTDALEPPTHHLNKALPYSEFLPLINKVKESDFRTAFRDETSSADYKLNVRVSSSRINIYVRVVNNCYNNLTISSCLK